MGRKGETFFAQECACISEHAWRCLAHSLHGHCMPQVLVQPLPAGCSQKDACRAMLAGRAFQIILAGSLPRSLHGQNGKPPSACRYEKVAFQKAVQEQYSALKDSNWHVLDASQEIDSLQQQVSMRDGGLSYTGSSFNITLLHTYSPLKVRMRLCCRFRL